MLLIILISTAKIGVVSLQLDLIVKYRHQLRIEGEIPKENY